MELNRRIRIAVLLLLSATAQRFACGQIPTPSASSKPAAEKPPEPDPFGRDTPHGCVMGFLRAATRENYVRAAEYLNLKAKTDAPELAHKLRIILDVGLAANLDLVSREPEGDLLDGLSENRERIGTIDTGTVKLDVLLDRVRQGSRPPIWLFSAETLHSVPSVFDEINAYGVERLVPEGLREIRILKVPLYRWLEVVLGVVLALVLAKLATHLLVLLLRPVIRRMTREEVDQRLSRMTAPLRVIFLAAGVRMLAAFSATVLGRQAWTNLAAVLAVIGFAWLLIRLSDIVAELARRRLTRSQRAGKLAVLNLFHRLSKIVVAILAVLLMIYASGKDVTTLLAGLGLGGIAIAFAAQKTLENLFGGVSIISDEPMRVGDFCRIGDKTGTIEDIGLRSTRVRTMDRTVVSIPNGQLAQINIENFALRDKFFCNHQIGLRYETTPEQMRSVLAGVRELLQAHPNVEQESLRVRLTAFGASAFNLEVFAYFSAADYPAFLAIQEEVLLGVLDIVVASGSGLAFPSQTTYLARDKANDHGSIEQAAARVRLRQEQVRPAVSGSGTK